jgi:hypothetical protein
MLAKMGANMPHVWTVPPTPVGIASVAAGGFEGIGKAGDGIAMGQG